MAVNKEITAERVLGLSDQLMQRRMVGAIEVLDAPVYLGEAQLLRVDLLPAGHNARNCAEPHSDARRAGIDKIWLCVLEHCLIELIGLSVDVDIGARETGR